MTPYMILECFDITTEDLIEEEEIQNINLDELSKMLGVSIKELFIGGYVVDEKNKHFIQKIYGKKIDLKKYIYNFEIRND